MNDVVFTLNFFLDIRRLVRNEVSDEDHVDQDQVLKILFKSQKK